MAVAAAAFAVLAGLPSRGALVVFKVVFTLGELMVVPTLDTLASLLAPAASMAAYLGVASLGWALSGVAGNGVPGPPLEVLRPRFLGGVQRELRPPHPPSARDRERRQRTDGDQRGADPDRRREP